MHVVGLHEDRVLRLANTHVLVDHIAHQTALTGVRLDANSVVGAVNGIRIKSNSSKGGLVRDVVYEDVCIRETKNAILMETDYMHMAIAALKSPCSLASFCAMCAC